MCDWPNAGEEIDPESWSDEDRNNGDHNPEFGWEEEDD